jgi:site-specific recombinase XerD
MIKPTDFAVHLTRFLGSHLPGHIGASTNTIKSYRDTFALFIKYCQSEQGLPPERLHLKHCTRNIIDKFLTWIESTRGCSIATRNQRLAGLHSFFRYLQVEEPGRLLQCQEILTIRVKKHPRASVNYLSLEGLKTLFSMINTDSIRGRRDLTLLSILYDTGARVQEIADLVVVDVRLDAPPTIKLTGKGQKSRIVPLVPQTVALLKSYMQERKLTNPMKKDWPLFYNKNRSKLTRSGISYILEKYVMSARIKNPEVIPETITPHCLRHSKAMHLLQAGVNLIYVRDLLGHADIQTTEIYARADTEMKRKALEKAYHQVGPSALPVWQEDTELLSWLQNLGNSKIL